MGSKTYDGVWFTSYSNDHWPPHVHARYAETMIILELTPNGVVVSDRKGARKPRNAKKSDIFRILKIAVAYETELNALWRKTHAAP